MSSLTAQLLRNLYSTSGANKSVIFNTVRLLSDGASNGLVRRELLSKNSIVRLILNDPQKRNALSLPMIEALHKELKDAESIKEARAVIIAAEGRVYSSGHDINELKSSEGVEKHKRLFNSCAAMLSHIQTMSLPVIAEVNGIAAAAGCQLVATCDIVIAGKTSKFSVPGAKVGVFCSTPGIPLARCIPRKVALDMLLTADYIDADKALQVGLVSRVVDDNLVHQEAVSVAKKIASLSRSIVSLGKNFFYTQVELPINDAYRMGSRVMVDTLRLVDSQEGIDAFVNKRKPNWTNTNKKAH